MTRQNLLNALNFLNLEEIPSIEIFILDRPIEDESGEVSCNVYKGRMHRDVPKQITDIFYPKKKRSMVNSDYSLEKYDPTFSPDRDVRWQFSASEVPFYNYITKQLSEIEDIYYNDETLPYEDIWAIWIKLRIQKTNFFILKKITPSKIITSGGALAWVFRDETFRKLENDVLTLDGSFDAIVFNNIIIFENKQKFETIFLYDDRMREVANETLEEIKKINLVENFKDLSAMLADDKHSIRKLNKLSQKKYFSEKTFDDYYRIIKEYNVGVTVDIRNKKFKLLNKAQAKLLVKVLNDDYLKSELTAIKYAANSKETL